MQDCIARDISGFTHVEGKHLPVPMGTISVGSIFFVGVVVFVGANSISLELPSFGQRVELCSCQSSIF